MTRQECAAMVVGGPTTVLDVGGLRIVSDPTFDDPGPHDDAGLTARLRLVDHGTWIPLRP
jgi:hypothetical protein